MHTLVGATAAGLVTSAALIAGISIVTRRRDPLAGISQSLRSEAASTAIVVGGVIGGTSHSILDAIVHSDVRPFAPFSDANPFFHSLGPGVLEMLCVVLGLLGVILLAFRLSRESTRA
jgi:membrane-bound metal-dependent hydrolase YbcI (DUF457 family)